MIKSNGQDGKNAFKTALALPIRFVSTGCRMVTRPEGPASVDVGLLTTKRQTVDGQASGVPTRVGRARSGPSVPVKPWLMLVINSILVLLSIGPLHGCKRSIARQPALDRDVNELPAIWNEAMKRSHADYAAEHSLGATSIPASTRPDVFRQSLKYGAGKLTVSGTMRKGRLETLYASCESPCGDGSTSFMSNFEVMVRTLIDVTSEALVSDAEMAPIVSQLNLAAHGPDAGIREVVRGRNYYRSYIEQGPKVTEFRTTVEAGLLREGEPPTIATPGRKPQSGNGITPVGDDVAYGKGTFYKTAADGGTGAVLASVPLSDSLGEGMVAFTKDAESIYWVGTDKKGSGVVTAISITSGETKVLARLGSHGGLSVAVNDKTVFFGTDNGIFSIPKGGGKSPKKVADASKVYFHLAAIGDRLYWAEGLGAYTKLIDADPATAEKIAVPQPVMLYSSGRRLYWASGAARANALYVCEAPTCRPELLYQFPRYAKFGSLTTTGNGIFFTLKDATGTWLAALPDATCPEQLQCPLLRLASCADWCNSIHASARTVYWTDEKGSYSLDKELYYQK